MGSRNTTAERLYNYKQVAYLVKLPHKVVYDHLKQRGLSVNIKRLFTKEQLIRYGLLTDGKAEVYYIYESKMNYE